MIRNPFVVVAAVPASALLMTAINTTAFAQGTNNPARNFGHYHGPGMMWGGDHWGGIGMFLGFFFMILLVFVIIVAVVFAMRSLGVWGMTNAPAGLSRNTDQALDILKQRFAKGEIDAEEFDERKRLLLE